MQAAHETLFSQTSSIDVPAALANSLRQVVAEFNAKKAQVAPGVTPTSLETVIDLLIALRDNSNANQAYATTTGALSKVVAKKGYLFNSGSMNAASTIQVSDAAHILMLVMKNNRAYFENSFKITGNIKFDLKQHMDWLPKCYSSIVTSEELQRTEGDMEDADVRLRQQAHQNGVPTLTVVTQKKKKNQEAKECDHCNNKISTYHVQKQFANGQFSELNLCLRCSGSREQLEKVARVECFAKITYDQKSHTILYTSLLPLPANRPLGPQQQQFVPQQQQQVQQAPQQAPQQAATVQGVDPQAFFAMMLAQNPALAAMMNQYQQQQAQQSFQGSNNNNNIPQQNFVAPAGVVGVGGEIPFQSQGTHGSVAESEEASIRKKPTNGRRAKN